MSRILSHLSSCQNATPHLEIQRRRTTPHTEIRCQGQVKPSPPASGGRFRVRFHMCSCLRIRIRSRHCRCRRGSRVAQPVNFRFHQGEPRSSWSRVRSQGPAGTSTRRARADPSNRPRRLSRCATCPTPRGRRSGPGRSPATRQSNGFEIGSTEYERRTIAGTRVPFTTTPKMSRKLLIVGADNGPGDPYWLTWNATMTT